MQPMDITKARSLSKILVQGKEVDPSLIIIQLRDNPGNTLPIQMRLPTDVIIFEMYQAEVAVDERNRNEFILADFKEGLKHLPLPHFDIIMALHRQSEKRNNCVSLFSKKTKPPPIYKWVKMIEYRIEDECLVVDGLAENISPYEGKA